MTNFVELVDNKIILSGSWHIDNYANIQLALQHLSSAEVGNFMIDGSNITYMDSAGAMALQKYVNQLPTTTKVELVGFTTKTTALLDKNYNFMAEPSSFPIKDQYEWILLLGKALQEKIENLLLFINFLGKTYQILISNLSAKRVIAKQELLFVMETAGLHAVPIVALLSCLIGVVFTYQTGIQLKVYGSQIYIAYYSGMAMLREFSPLITAIICAGRTSSAFAAFIGMMKVNQEIDALETMGVSAIFKLVIPRILGILLVLPMLTFLADVFGIFGCMLMSKSLLDINFYDYLIRLQEDLPVKHYLIGLAKTPLFAFIIAFTGCFQGFMVKNTADGVGKHTTYSVVQAIFLIVIIDAIFAIVFSWRAG